MTLYIFFKTLLTTGYCKEFYTVTRDAWGGEQRANKNRSKGLTWMKKGGEEGDRGREAKAGMERTREQRHLLQREGFRKGCIIYL